MKIRLNRPILNEILINHGADKERVERLNIVIKEEPHLIPKDHNIIIRSIKRFFALFHSPLGLYMSFFSEETIIIYKTRTGLALDNVGDILALECGHFLDAGWKKPLPKIPGVVRFFAALCRDLRDETVAKRIANKALKGDPRWNQVIGSDS